MKILKFIIDIPKELAKVFIKIYQKTLSFDHSFWARPDLYRVCIHYPSCSEYAYEAIDRFGFIKGTMMGSARVLRCNPFNKGGHDPVPDHFSLKANPQD